MYDTTSETIRSGGVVAGSLGFGLLTVALVDAAARRRSPNETDADRRRPRPGADERV